MGVFPEFVEYFDEELRDKVLRDGVLFYQNEEWAMYMYKGAVYLLEPSTFDSELQRAVIEAGFATEPLRHAIKELYECMYLRMMADGMRGFSEREWQAVLRAKELLGLT